jgi:hypothetical protein
MVTQAIPVDQLREQAAQARPHLVLATAISAVFVAIGWVLGRGVTGLAFCALAARYGYRLGRGTLAAVAEAAGPPPNPRL